MIHPDEPFTISEIQSMTPAQLGDLLGEVFGFYAGQRLVVERDHAGAAAMVIEVIASRTFPSSDPRKFELAHYTAPCRLRAAGVRPDPPVDDPQWSFM